MKLSGTNYCHLKTENLLLIHGSISEKLSLYLIFGTQKKNCFFARPGSQEAGTGPGKPGRTGKYRKTREKKIGWPGAGPESGISVLRILLTNGNPFKGPIKRIRPGRNENIDYSID